MEPIFCPQCQAYLGPRPACTCGWTRSRPLPASGQLDWQVEAGGPVAALSLAFFDSGALLLVSLGRRGEPGGGLLALDPRNGEERWRYRTPAAVEGSAVQVRDRLLFGDEAGHLHALDAGGRPVWAAPLELGSPLRTPAPDPDDEVLTYVTTASGTVAALDARRGRIVWRWVLPGNLTLPTPPLPLGPVLLVAAAGAPWEGGILSALRRTDGREVWRLGLEANPHAPLSAAEGRILLALTDGTLHALDPRSRLPHWTFQTRGGRPIVAAPAVAGETIYVAAHDHCLYALDSASGQVRWSFDAGHGLVTPPQPVESGVCVGDNRGRLWLIEAEGGEKLWSLKLAARPAAPAGPLVHQGIVYGGTSEGRVVALPWHLGRWEDLARRAEDCARLAEAAVWWALAGESERAADLFARAGRHEPAARIYETCRGRLTDAARTWEQAAARADFPAYYWDRAARLWDKLDQRAQAESCRRRAAEARGGPYLAVEVIGSDPFRRGDVGTLRLCVANEASAVACDLQIGVEGDQIRSVSPRRRPELAEGDRWDLRLDNIEPLQSGTIRLVLVVQYTDRHGTPYISRWETRVQVAPPERPPIQATNLFTGPARVTHVEGDVGLLRIGERKQAGGPSQATVGGDVGQARIAEGEAQVGGDVGLLRVGGRDIPDPPPSDRHD